MTAGNESEGRHMVVLNSIPVNGERLVISAVPDASCTAFWETMAAIVQELLSAFQKPDEERP